MRGLPTMLQLGPSTVFKGVNFTLFCVLATIASASGPVSLTTLGGTNAQFHCNGSGSVLAWEVDGLPLNHPNIVDREITKNTTVSSSGTVQSTLTVPATQENDGTTVRCYISPSVSSLPTLIGNSSTLTVLPGIGPVVNVRFSVSFNSLLWDPPATAGVLSGLSYIVIVMNNNTGQVIVNVTTTNTIYPLPPLPFCQYYTANVTAFSSQHRSESVVTGQRQGEIYILTSSQDIDVTRKDNTSINLSVHLNLEVLDGLPCPNQMLKFQTYPQDDVSNITDHSEVLVSGRGDHVYPIIVTEGKQLCIAAISLIANDAVVNVLNLNFSTFDVQNCNITTSTDQSSIMVECRFAVNATALSGIAVIKDEHDKQIRDEELNIKLGNNMKSVNITDLPTGNYKASVFDDMEDNQPAYQYPKFLKIVSHSPTPTPSTTVVRTDIPFSVSGSVFISKSSNVAATSTPRPAPPAVKTVSTLVIIGSSVAAVIVMIILVILPGLCILSLRSYYRQKACLAPDLTTVFKIEKENEYSVVNIKPRQPVHVVNINTSENCTINLQLEASSEYHSTTPPTIDAYKEKHLVQQPISSPASECTVTYSKKTAKQKELVYADLHHSTNPPVAPLPAENVPVHYATVQPQTTKEKVSGEPVYADLYHSANPPAPPLPAEKVQYITVTSQPTMSNNSSHVQNQDTLLLHTSTRTSDYCSAQSSRSTDSDPQTSVESSESNAETLSLKISDYSSDLKECNIPNIGTNGSFYQEPHVCTDNNDNAEIVSESTTLIIPVVEEEDTRSCYWSKRLISNGTRLEFFSEYDAAPAVHNKTSEPSVETIPDACHTTSKLVCITPKASVLNKTNTQYTTHNTKSASIPSFSANWAASDKGDRSYTPDCDWSNSVRRRNC